VIIFEQSLSSHIIIQDSDPIQQMHCHSESVGNRRGSFKCLFFDGGIATDGVIAEKTGEI
jgi:hypothetical protein